MINHESNTIPVAPVPELRLKKITIQNLSESLPGELEFAAPILIESVTTCDSVHTCCA